jgi:2-polyprenyl-6-methoxyphenol hydroxylase-like FAD-dependent oxidoreductase
MESPRALIVGGGFAGLAAAVALTRAGLSASVFERASAAREVNAGVSLWGNAIRALAKLGLARHAIDAGDIITTATLMNARGRVISRCDIADADRALGYPSIVIHRQALLDLLLSALEPGTVRYGEPCETLHHGRDRVTLHTTRGHEVGDLLIGADGGRSRVRSVLFGERPLRYSGYTCWRGVLDYPLEGWPSGHAAEGWGRGQRFGITRLDRQRVYWWATRNAAPGGRDADARAELLRHYKGWAAPVPELLERTLPAAITRTDIVDLPPTRQWGVGRVTLIGDAAHAPTPNLGQGACMVIEDAVVLAKHLTEYARGRMAPDAALRAYERDRYARTAMVTNVSWRLGRVGQWTNPVMCALRNLATSLVPRFMFMQNHRSVVGFEAG